MTIPNHHDRRTLEAIVAGMETEAIVRSIDEGGLSAFAKEVATEELARRVLADDVDYGPGARGRAPRLLYGAAKVFAGCMYLIWAAWWLSLLAGVRL